MKGQAAFRMNTYRGWVVMAGPQSSKERRRFRSPMPGHPRLWLTGSKTWMPATSAGMTNSAAAKSLPTKQLLHDVIQQR
jgi:hypothetical protein